LKSSVYTIEMCKKQPLFYQIRYFKVLGPYQAKDDDTIAYCGNKLFDPIPDITGSEFPVSEIEKRVEQLQQESIWGHIARINHQINKSVNEFFDKQGALYTPLPQVTRMISSPGAKYGTQAISYTSDTCPITLSWFDMPKEAFLSESSQIYLEIALLQEKVDHVYAVYRSFRKEHADATHLSEFHHIEYEGKVSQQENENIALSLLQCIITDLLANNEEELSQVLSDKKLSSLEEFSSNIKKTPFITYQEAMKALFKETGKTKYQSFSMKDCFGSWEEVRLTELFGGMVAIREFPLLEVPFYHAQKSDVDPVAADNTDFIWPGYREILGSGQRVRSREELEYKAEVFDLPLDDYRPYLETRESQNYKPTSGFGLGWERLLQGLLEMPFIWSASQFPRGHSTLKP